MASSDVDVFNMSAEDIRGANVAPARVMEEGERESWGSGTGGHPASGLTAAGVASGARFDPESGGPHWLQAALSLILSEEKDLKREGVVSLRQALAGTEDSSRQALAAD